MKIRTLLGAGFGLAAGLLWLGPGCAVLGGLSSPPPHALHAPADAAAQHPMSDVLLHQLLISGLLTLSLAAIAALTIRRIEQPLRVALEPQADGDERVQGFAEAEQIASKLAQLRAALAQEQARSARTLELTRALLGASDVAAASSAALSTLVRNFEALGGAIWVVREQDAPLSLLAIARIDRQAALAGREVAEEVRSSRARIVLSGARSEARGATKTSTTTLVPEQVWLLPLLHDGRVLAVLELSMPRASDELLGELEALTPHLALALDHARRMTQSGLAGIDVTGQHAELLKVLESLSEAVVLLDEHTNVRLSNPAAESLFGPIATAEPAELRRRLSVAMPATFDAALERGAAVNNALRRIIDSDGTPHSVMVNAVPVRMRDDEVAQVVLSVRDVSEEYALREQLAYANTDLRFQNEELRAQEEELRAQAEELAAQQQELAHRNDELALASRMKSAFLASISHELRTPLNAVIGFSEVLIEGVSGALSDEQQERIQDILTAGRQLLALVNDILDLSKIEAGKIDLHVEHVDVANPIEEAAMLLDTAARAKGILVENHVLASQTTVLADPERVRQVVANLLSNAVKFTPAGGRVTIDAERQGEVVRIAVTDTGIGISAGDLPRLFQPFSQLDAGLKRKFGGTGLGLSISRRLVELMGGEISVHSRHGEGSTFSFTLPSTEGQAITSDRGGLRQVAPLSSSAPVSSSMAAAPSSTTLPTPDVPPAQPSQDRTTVLLVEDEGAEARLAEGVLARAGYEVMVARSAEQALLLAAQQPPSLLLVDIGLPDISGLSLIERIKAQPAMRDVPVAVLTGTDLTREQYEQLTRTTRFIAQKGSLSRAEFVRRLTDICPPKSPRDDKGKGTSLFSGTFPAAAPISLPPETPIPSSEPALPPPASSKPPEPPPAVLTQAPITERAGPASILVVDDNDTNRRVVKAMLSHTGAVVHEAQDAAQALTLARSLLPSLVLMDLEMPGMDGLEATRALAADARTAKIPVIALTAHAMVGDKERVLAAGCVGYVAKPMGRASLYGAIDAALGGEGWRQPRD